ncbi:MAG TPA: amidohydrolase family protein [Vicinamibacteria bacterium]|nr:amidohydrolase family protein [Vicinamibacteria bacterium]
MHSVAIDVHTHMLHQDWLALLKRRGGPRYTVAPVGRFDGVIHLDGTPFMTPLPEMFDYDLRIRNMDRARVDVAVVSLTCPNVYWGDAATSLEAARILNDDMASAQRSYPDRIRFFASLPWQHPALAVEELARACGEGAVGVMVLANVDGRSLTDEAFSPIWKAADDAALPVLVHPTAPPGVREMDMAKHNLVPPVGFVFDTTLALARMLYDGFLDRYPNVKLIAAHGGGALPYLVGRLDICHEKIPNCGARTKELPGEGMRRIYVDSVVFRQEALELAVAVCGPENVLYGSDYPHNIGDMAGCLSRVDALAAGVRDKVRGENARRIFGL